MPSGMNDALWPLRTKVVSANAASPRGAGSATGQNPGSSRSVEMAMRATSFSAIPSRAPLVGAFANRIPSDRRRKRRGGSDGPRTPLYPRDLPTNWARRPSRPRPDIFSGTATHLAVCVDTEEPRQRPAMAGHEPVSPFSEGGKRREDGGERTPPGKQSRERAGGCARGEEPPVSSDQMPRIEAGAGRNRREQARPFLALDRNRTHALRAIPGEDLVERPFAEAAVLVVQQNALRATAQWAIPRGADATSCPTKTATNGRA